MYEKTLADKDFYKVWNCWIVLCYKGQKSIVCSSLLEEGSSFTSESVLFKKRFSGCFSLPLSASPCLSLPGVF